MHETIVKTKAGLEFSGYIWSWKPKEGWFSLAGCTNDGLNQLPGDGLKLFKFDDLESAITKNQRTFFNTIADRDELERARFEIESDSEKGVTTITCIKPNAPDTPPDLEKIKAGFIRRVKYK